MPVTVVVGGQFGSEGKGKVAHYLAREMHATFAVRCGGSNSGHTVIDDSGNAVIFRHLPTAALLPDVKLVVCAGSYIDEDVLLEEIHRTNVTPERLFIAPNAVVITPEYKMVERNSGLVTDIGSTGSGTGAAVIARIKRRSEHVTFAKDCPRLKPFIKNDVTGMLRAALDRQERIILEGTQGFGLSVLHSPYYPYVTSRDTTAAAFVAEAGLSPTDVDDVVLVIRTFPIRVAGDSGPLPNETTWEDITQEGGHEEKIGELTSVTKKPRRVAKFDADIVKRAIYANKPNRVVLNHVDYISKNISDDSVRLMESVRNFEEKISTRIDFIGLSRKDIRVFHDNANMNFIPPGMLSSPHIKQYVRSGLLVKVPQGTEDVECFKSATYDMRLGDTSYRFEGNNLKIKKIGGDQAKSDYVTLESNSLTFVITHEEFNLPKDVIARFNLKGKLIHKGLLLGTGPIIDPEFHGKLLIPIHNFSSSPVDINYLEPFISVEFTKTLCVSSLPGYVPNKNAVGDPERYLRSMGVVESSVYRKFTEMEENLKEQRRLNEQDKRSLEISRTVLIFTWLTLFLSTICFYCHTNSRLDSLFTHFSQQSTGGTKHSEQIESNYNLLWVRPVPGKDNAR